MESINLTWTQIKSAKNTFKFNFSYIDTEDNYIIWGTDGLMKFVCTLKKLDDPVVGTDQKDFEDNYKTLPDTNARTDGKTLIYNSPRPIDCTTYFTGAGDDANGNISAGDQLIFSLAANESSKSIDLHFREDIWFKDGQIWSNNDTPLGAYIDVEIVHPYAGVVGSVGRKIFLLKDWLQPLDTEDRGLVPAGLIIRITVHNSDGTGSKDPAAAFKVVGRLEIYRVGQA